ncbi:integral membrane protein [Streptomyces sp. e14]|nr:integral membrane protein [Streptomyces sp. e14]
MGGVGGVGGGPGGGVGGGSGVRNITALPAAIARGGRLTITVEGCRNGGTASSPAFAPTPLRPFNAAGETARGTATIRFDARPGTYDITANCDGRSLTRPAAFTVVGGVNGGVGGGTTTGATKADVAIGGGLLAAGAVGGGVFWLRRRAGKRV